MTLDPDTGELVWNLTPEELETLKLVGLGCHRTCYDAVEAVFRRREIVSWTFSDYFLLQPLSREDAIQRIAPRKDRRNADELPRWCDENLERPQLYYPFFERRIRALEFLVDADPGGDMAALINNPSEATRRADERRRRQTYTPLLEAERRAHKRPPKGRARAVSKARAQMIHHVMNWPIKSNDRQFSKWLRRDFRTFVSLLPPASNGMWLIREWAYARQNGTSSDRATRVDEKAPRPPAGRPQVKRRHPPYTAWGITQEVFEQLVPPSDKQDDRLTEEQRALGRNDRAAARVEHAVNDHFWLLRARPAPDVAASDAASVNAPAVELVAVSIASESHFYGYLVVEYPPQTARNDRTLRAELEQALSESASRSYLDVLVLFFNRVYENRLKKKLELSVSESPSLCKDKLTAFFDSIPFERLPKSGEQHQPLSEVEDWVRWLWAQREDWVTNILVPAFAELSRDRPGTPVRADDLEPILAPFFDSLVLGKMQIASPPMVDIIRQLMNFHIEYKPDVSQLPSVLVIGGPGSGKDNIARLISLFGAGYTFGKIQTINMAAMRPQALVGPLLQGAELGLFRSDPVFPAVKKGEKEHPVTVILDELNSLDVDQQGILLRVLENREVTPLFTKDTRRANFLCVGVMNEQPEDLMKEDELRVTTARSNMFGKLLGTFVDEMFRRARRLRPDLFYRMQRYGVITLPNLSDRRADIPILFQSFLPREDALKRKLLYDIELSVYERLMDKDLMWPGNIRELQAITRQVYLRVEQKAAPKNVPRSSSSKAVARKRVMQIRIQRDDVDWVLGQNLDSKSRRESRQA